MDQEAGKDAAPAPADPAVMSLFGLLAAGREVRFVTDHGEIRLLLYDALMPKTTKRFVELVNSGFYDDTIIHRVVDDFVIQGGDPSGTGLLGSGQTIPHETHPDLRFGFGAMGLARDADPDSGDSQWFITETPQPHLHDPQGTTAATYGTFAVYGQVFAGMDVVASIAAVTTLPGLDRPVEDVHLQYAEILGPPAVDLLSFPLNVTSLGPGSAQLHVERPLYVFEDRAFNVTIHVDSGAAPASMMLRYVAGEDRTVEVLPDPTPSDPLVYAATVVLPHAGPWVESVTVGEDSAQNTLAVHGWHPEYVRFDRSAP